MFISSITDAKASLSKLIEQAQAGQEIIIGKAGKPVAKLTAYHLAEQDRQLGSSWQGKITIADDFDEPITEIEQLFNGE